MTTFHGISLAVALPVIGMAILTVFVLKYRQLAKHISNLRLSLFCLQADRWAIRIMQKWELPKLQALQAELCNPNWRDAAPQLQELIAGTEKILKGFPEFAFAFAELDALDPEWRAQLAHAVKPAAARVLDKLIADLQTVQPPS